MAHYNFKADEYLHSAIEPIAQSASFRKSEIIFHEGEPVRGLYLIVSGKVELLLRSAGSVTLVRRAGAGCLLGVPASINHHPYSLTARVTEDAELLFVSKKALAALMKREPQVTMAFVEMLSNEVRGMRQVIARSTIAANNARTTVGSAVNRSKCE